MLKTTGHYGNRGFTFDINDTDNIYRFVNALHNVKNVEDIEVSEINAFGIVSVSFSAKTDIADALCSTLIDAFKTKHE